MLPDMFDIRNDAAEDAARLAGLLAIAKRPLFGIEIFVDDRWERIERVELIGPDLVCSAGHNGTARSWCFGIDRLPVERCPDWRIVRTVNA